MAEFVWALIVWSKVSFKKQAVSSADWPACLMAVFGGECAMPMLRSYELGPLTQAMALKHTQDKPVEKATRRAGVVPPMPAPALLSLARAAVHTLLPHDPHCSVRMLLPHDCCCCPMCTPQALQTGASQAAGRSPPRSPPKAAAAQPRQSRVRFAYAPFASCSVPPAPYEVYDPMVRSRRRS